MKTIMQKDFDGWIVQKKKAHHVHERPMFKEREVWWCSLGANVGDEQDGKGRSFSRPILVIKKFNRNVFVGVPFSTQIKENQFYYPPIQLRSATLWRESVGERWFAAGRVRSTERSVVRRTPGQFD